VKLLHFSDLHLGVETYGHIDPATGLSSRLGDFLRCLDVVVERALEGDVDLVLFCGDAYKSRRPEPTEQREFARRLARLASREIPVLLLTGNHDTPAGVGRAAALEVFPALAVKNLTVAHRPGTYPVETRSGLLQIVALPWPRPGAFLAREEARGLGMEELDRRVEEGVYGVLEDEVKKLDPEVPAVLAAHFWVYGAKVGSERGMVVGREPVFQGANLAREAFSYIALGHIHRMQILRQDHPVVAYSGSLERLDFSEEGGEKGFFLVDIKGKEALPAFHPTPARRFLTVEISPDPVADPTRAVLEAISLRAGEIKGAIVRVQVKLAEGAAINEAEVRKALKEAYFVLPIAIQVERKARPRLAVEARGLPPEKALELYLDIKQVPNERKARLLDYGQRLLREKAEGL